MKLKSILMKKNYKLFTTGLIAIAINSASAQCPIPSLVTASPSTICSGATTTLNATAIGASINWFTVPVGGTAVGTSASAANFAISPTITTTYYAESIGASSTFMLEAKALLQLLEVLMVVEMGGLDLLETLVLVVVVLLMYVLEELH